MTLLQPSLPTKNYNNEGASRTPESFQATVAYLHSTVESHENFKQMNDWNAGPKGV